MRVLCLLLLGIAAQLAFVDADGHERHCYDDMDWCLGELRRLVVSDDAFWFGEDYHERCVMADGKVSPSPDCSMNPDLHKNVIARFLNSSQIDGLADNLQMLEVVFDSPAGHYYGCDSYTWTDHVDGYHLDPLMTVEVNQWVLDHLPKVTFKPKDAATLYTILIWDVGYFYLHGFYINVRDGDMSTGTPLDAYHGPKNPSPTANQLLFMAIEQPNSIDAAQVGATLWSLMASNGNALRPTALLAALPGRWTVPHAVNMMTIKGDTYAAQFQKDHYIVDYCPYLASQHPDIYNVMNEAKLPGKWSYDENMGNPRGHLIAEERPYLKSLTTAMKVEYHSDDLWMESCCKEYHYRKQLYRVNTFEHSTALPAITRNKPIVQFSPMTIFGWNPNPYDKIYTLMMVDMTDAANKRDDQNLIVHWLVVNIHRADVGTGNELIYYVGPLPADRYEQRVYVFMLFEQSVDFADPDASPYTGDNCPNHLYQRCEARLTDMIKDWNLNLVGVTWFKAEQDPYVRYMIYNQLYTDYKANVCSGELGFEDPCPDKCHGGPGPNHAPTVMTSSVVIALFALISVVATEFF